MDDARPPPVRTAPATGVQVVGLGASAGGLEPLAQFLSNVPTASGFAYLVVQHMDPTHITLLGELLQRATSMPVHEAVDAKPIERDSAYLIPPDSELTVLAGALQLVKPTEPRWQRLPIDVLFGSLSRELGDRAIGVVLSGMGSDGTPGPAGDQGATWADPGAATRVCAVRFHAQERHRCGLCRHRRPARGHAAAHLGRGRCSARCRMAPSRTTRPRHG